MRKFNFRESQTLDFQFWDKYGAVSYTEILYMIQSNRVENASNASMPLYTTQSIFVYRGTQVYNLHIVQWRLNNMHNPAVQVSNRVHSFRLI